jgi:hypothetical protein
MSSGGPERPQNHAWRCSWTPQGHQHAGVRHIDNSVAVEVDQQAHSGQTELADEDRRVPDIGVAVGSGVAGDVPSWKDVVDDGGMSGVASLNRMNEGVISSSLSRY